METKMEITKEDCEAYENVGVSGITNMWAVDMVCELSGVDRKKIVFIMDNYNKLNIEFNFRK